MLNVFPKHLVCLWRGVVVATSVVGMQVSSNQVTTFAIHPSNSEPVHLFGGNRPCKPNLFTYKLSFK